MRYLAVDLGDRRTGLAVGDDVTKIVTPVDVIEIPRPAQEGRLIEAVAEAAREHGAMTIVLGLPVNMDGTEGPRAKVVRDFGAKLATTSSLGVLYQDERLTSDAAEEGLKRSGKTRGEKKAIRDALAAAVILKDFFSSQ